MSAALVRPSSDRWIAGVCSAIGRRFGISSNIVRLIFVLSCLLPGPQFIVYIVCWIVFPSDR